MSRLDVRGVESSYVSSQSFVTVHSSFPMCYAVEFGTLPLSVEDGVPMEHLISCVPGVEIVISKKGVKVIHFQENKDPPGAGTVFVSSHVFFFVVVLNWFIFYCCVSALSKSFVKWSCPCESFLCQ